VGTGTKEDESSTGRVWVAGFHHVTARTRLARFEAYEPFISLIFHFWGAAVNRRYLKPRILNQWLRGHDCAYFHRQYLLHIILIAGCFVSTFEFLTMFFLKKQVFWRVTLRRWGSGGPKITASRSSRLQS
jgi:hypothetical protein